MFIIVLASRIAVYVDIYVWVVIVLIWAFTCWQDGGDSFSWRCKESTEEYKDNAQEDTDVNDKHGDSEPLCCKCSRGGMLMWVSGFPLFVFRLDFYSLMVLSSSFINVLYDNQIQFQVKEK